RHGYGWLKLACWPVGLLLDFVYTLLASFASLRAAEEASLLWKLSHFKAAWQEHRAVVRASAFTCKPYAPLVGEF
ncbi:hypothetical protein, partial [Pseudomonas sp. FFUP_PS_473]|uniref:hypothetical protein n=1 Tax=Pseudomonas sp. FFUP_PS_473 TaxID=2060418 RepID=UPI001C458A39